jgi:hypothetical protein
MKREREKERRRKWSLGGFELGCWRLSRRERGGGNGKWEM